MEKKIIEMKQEVVELSRDQFNDLIADMLPGSVAQLHETARDILSMPKILERGNDQALMESLEKCRRMLNTQHMLRSIMHAFNPPETKQEAKG